MVIMEILFCIIGQAMHLIAVCRIFLSQIQINMTLDQICMLRWVIRSQGSHRDEAVSIIRIEKMHYTQ